MKFEFNEIWDERLCEESDNFVNWDMRVLWQVILDQVAHENHILNNTDVNEGLSSNLGIAFLLLSSFYLFEI